MSTPPPIISDNELYQLLRDHKIEEFNKRKGDGESVDLRGCDFRGLDLQGVDFKGLDLTDSYFRTADLRGVDLSQTRLEGVSIHGAKISGAYFPKELSPEEIRLSLDVGIRMRYR